MTSDDTHSGEGGQHTLPWARAPSRSTTGTAAAAAAAFKCSNGSTSARQCQLRRSARADRDHEAGEGARTLHRCMRCSGASERPLLPSCRFPGRRPDRQRCAHGASRRRRLHARHEAARARRRAHAAREHWPRVQVGRRGCVGQRSGGLITPHTASFCVQAAASSSSSRTPTRCASRCPSQPSASRSSAATT